MTGPPFDPRVYYKNGHQVLDTPALDRSGHVPTHRLDQPTNRYPGESWEEYQQRVLARRSFSPDTARVSSLSALEPDVADSTRSLLRDAAASGVHLQPAETRRTQERQEMLFQKGRTTPGDVATWTLTSDHTPGRAVDFTGDSNAYKWLQEHAPAHGFGVLGDMDPGHVSMPGALPLAQANPVVVPGAKDRPSFRAQEPEVPVGPSSRRFAAQEPPVAVGPSGPTPHRSFVAQEPDVPIRTNPVPSRAPVAQNAPVPVRPSVVVPHTAPASPPMTGPSLYDQYLASQGPAKPKTTGTGSLYDRYLTETSGADPNQALHDEYKSGRLAGRMARENANDRDESDAAQVSLPAAAGQALAATGANIAQGIPGMEAVQAYLRGKVRGQPYREALSDIRGNTEKIPTVLRVGERIAGAVPVAAMLPGSPTVSGAIVGGADQAFAADPDMSLTERGVRTVVGAGTGAVAGKVMDKAITAGSAMMTTRPATRLLQMMADRAASAKRLYDGALAEGSMKEATPAIQKFLSEPDIAELVSELQATTHAGTPAESPQMLDAIYKTLSDRAAVAKKGLDQLNPSRPNIGRFRMQDIKNRQQQLLRAMESPGEKPAMTMDVPAETHVVEPKITAGRDPMAGPVANGPVSTYTDAPNPTLSQGLRNFRGNTENAVQGPGGPQFQLRAQSDVVKPGVTVETPSMRIQTAPAEQMPPMMSGYRHAVEDFAQRTREIEALQRGYEAVRTQLAGGLPSAKNLTRKTPEAFAKWALTASPEEIQAAREGIRGAIKDALSLPGATFAPGRRAASVGAKLLHVAPTPGQTVLEGLQNAGLLWAGGASSPSPKSSLFPP